MPLATISQLHKNYFMINMNMKTRINAKDAVVQRLMRLWHTTRRIMTWLVTVEGLLIQYIVTKRDISSLKIRNRLSEQWHGMI